MSGQPDDLTAFSRALAEVAPHPGRLDRDALLFAAGRAAGRPGRFWPMTAGVLAAACIALAVTLVVRPPTVVEVVRVVPVRVPTPADTPLPDAEQTPGSDEPALAEGLRRRRRLLDEGDSSVPGGAWASGSSPDEVPDFSSLRLNAPSSERGRFR